MRLTLNDLTMEQLRAYQDRIVSEIAHLENHGALLEKDGSKLSGEERERLCILMLARIGVAREIADWPSVHPGEVSDNG